MGNFSRDTFDKLKHYIGVRLQQGVPLVDADWNEMEDIRRYEFQAFLKWFVGNGVPFGNDGFRIEAVSDNSPNDFIIIGSNAADNIGRCLVDGYEAINESPIRYTAQRLFSTSLAASWNVPPLDALNAPPAGNRTELVYVDIWEREVDSTEDTDLVNQIIGVETSVRIKCEWVVRTRMGTSIPHSGDTDYILGHSYYALATIIRRAGSPLIKATDIADLRGTMGLMPPATLIPDLFGIEPVDYRNGIGRPNIDLRTAINALLLGRYPTTPVRELSIVGNAIDFRMIKDPGNPNKFFIIWRSSEKQLFFSRGDFISGWDAAQRLTSDVADERQPRLVVDGNTLWVFWISDKQDPKKKWSLYGCTYGSAGAGAMVELGKCYSSEYTDSTGELSALRDSLGNIWVFWKSTDQFFYFRRKDPVTGWTSAQRVSSYPYSAYISYTETSISAIEGDSGVLFVCWNATKSDDWMNHVWKKRFIFSNNVWNYSETPSRITSDTYEENDPVVYKDNKGSIWLFFTRPRMEGGGGFTDSWTDLKYQRFSSSGYGISGIVVLTRGYYVAASAVYGSTGDLLAIFSASSGLVYKRFNGDSQEWGPDIALIDNPTGSMSTIGIYEERPGELRVMGRTGKETKSLTIITTL
jgi:hypothetical protein